MNKTSKFYVSIWAILLAIFNIAVFVSPSEAAGLSKFGGAFWAGYLFITAAFIGQLAVSLFAFKTENAQKLFYKIPLVRISYTGLILMLVFGSLCMTIPNLPKWLGVILCFAVLGFNAMAVIKANTAAELVGALDDTVKVRTSFIKELTVDAEGLLARAGSVEIKAECKKVYEAVRYSDPMSNAALVDIEQRIKKEFDALTDAVIADALDATELAVKELNTLINERNNKCKALK